MLFLLRLHGLFTTHVAGVFLHCGNVLAANDAAPNLLCIGCCVQAGVLPSGDAVVSIPSALVALCLNTSGLKRVRETAVLNVLIDIFTSKKTMKVLTSDTPAVLGGGVEELLR
jgi:hypothetical protein